MTAAARRLARSRDSHRTARAPWAERAIARWSSRCALVVVVAIASGCCPIALPEQKPPIRVAAASDMTVALDEIVRAFEAETKRRVRVSYGATGLLAKQIAGGAPFDLFIAADASVLDALVRDDTCDGSTARAFAEGSLVVVTRASSASPPALLSDLVDPRFTKIAIANPEHAPYGRAAKQALTRAAVWEAVSTRVVTAESVRHALRLVEDGQVEAALVARALVSGAVGLDVVPVDRALHDPIRQGVVVCRGGTATPGARRFLATFLGDDARATLEAHGFTWIPERTP